MPVSTRRTSTPCSLPSNWHCPSEQLLSQSQPFEDLSSWTLKSSTPTSGLNSKRIPFQQNTLTTIWNHGPLTLMVYYGSLDAFMFRILEIFDFVFSNTHTTIHLRDIMGRRRRSTKSIDTIIGLDLLSMSETTASHVPSAPAPNPCAINRMDFSSNFRFPRGLGIRSPWIS